MSAATETQPAAAPPEETQPAIRIRKLQHYFGTGETRSQALFDIDLEIMPGEIVVVKGRSGSGKTTLLTLIGTLRSVQEGSLEVFGRELRSATPAEILDARRNMGFIFQAHNLFGSLTAFQNVRMALELFGQHSAAQMRERCEAMLRRLDLGHRIHYKPGKLSGGQKQRVAVARGLVHGPRLVLADEPTAALDEDAARRVVNVFQEMARDEATTVLVVTHDDRIMHVADRMITITGGRITQNAIVRETAMVAEFLRTYPEFAALTPHTLVHVAERMIRERYAAGDVVIRQGDEGDKFYLIINGTAEVQRQREGLEDLRVVLGKGQYFGERALITREPRNATVTAREQLDLYSLRDADFQAVRAASATFDQEVRRAMFERQ